ncbi:MAG: hypothetical protein WC501_02895 [Candidatus Micrarchaeia archaeon]
MSEIDFLLGQDWYVTCVLAVFAVILVYGLFYAIARAFSFEELKRSSKSEILQSIATLLMILFVVTIINQLEEFSINEILGKNSYVVCGGTEIGFNDGNEPELKNVIDVVECRFVERSKELAQIQDDIITSEEGPGGVFTKLSMIIGVVGITVFEGNWVASWYYKAETIRLLNNFVITALIACNSILAIVMYLKANMLAVFLPFGLFLRSFKYSRGIGAFFIAMAFGFYFIFPILFVLTDPGFVEVPAIPKTNIDQSSNFCFPTFSGIVSQATTNMADDTTGIASLTFSKKAISQFYVYMTTHAFVVFAITLIFVRYMTFLFGGDAYELMRFVSKVI